MKRAMIALSVLACLTVAGGCMQANGRNASPAQLALRPSCQMVSQTWDINGVDLDLIGTENHNLAGAGVGTAKFAHRMDGVYGGVWGLFAWDATGVQAAGFVNNTADEMTGVQLAGFVNGVPSLDKRLRRLSDTDATIGGTLTLRGVQAATIYNCARRVYGVQAAGIANVAQEKVTGAQMALIVNAAKNAVNGRHEPVEVTGLQAAIVGNFGVTRVQGVQVAGIANNAKEGIEGLQVGGLVNSTRNLSGVQIGLLNFNKGGLLPFFPLINIGFGVEAE